MAAVIRYLSADNHIVDTPPSNRPGTGRHNTSLFHGCVFEMNVCQGVLYISEHTA